MGRTFADRLSDLLAGLLKKTPEFDIRMTLTEFFETTTFYNDWWLGHENEPRPEVTDKTYRLKSVLYGSFTAPDKKEVLALCGFDSTGHYSGSDRTIAVLMRAEGYEVLGYHDFYGVDTIQAFRLPTAAAQDQLLTITTWNLQGGRDTTVTQWDLTDGRFSDQKADLVKMHSKRFPNLRYAMYDNCRLIFADGVSEAPPTVWASEIGHVRYNFKWDEQSARFVSVPRYLAE